MGDVEVSDLDLQLSEGVGSARRVLGECGHAQLVCLVGTLSRAINALSGVRVAAIARLGKIEPKLLGERWV